MISENRLNIGTSLDIVMTVQNLANSVRISSVKESAILKMLIPTVLGAFVSRDRRWFECIHGVEPLKMEVWKTQGV